jgi:hypothetical protein
MGNTPRSEGRTRAKGTEAQVTGRPLTRTTARAAAGDRRKKSARARRRLREDAAAGKLPGGAGELQEAAGRGR